MQRFKTSTDYAVIALAPLLIFLMISSLANFLMMIVYRGGQPGRVSWTILMFTLGTVGIARVAIEKDRAYSLGYAVILGAVSLFSMMKFVDSILATVLILAVIAYLADWVVRDCTLIDEEADSSDQGLIGSGQLQFGGSKQDPVRQQADMQADGELEVAPEQKRRKKKRAASQPGRSVLYLSLAALPLYGLGQFMIRSDDATWARAQQLLAFYLFAAFSLLVTTSFLGLRRYLRQRDADMPAQVSIGWIGAGLGMIATILLIAFLVPVPGKLLASIELPAFLDSPGDLSASQYGWGDDAAENAGDQSAATSQDQSEKEKEVGSLRQEKGAEAGEVDGGDRKDGPTGKDEGSAKQSSDSASSEASKQNESGKNKQNGEQSSKQDSGEKQSSTQEPEESSESDRKSEDVDSESNSDPSDAEGAEPAKESTSQQPNRSEPNQAPEGNPSSPQSWKNPVSGLFSLLKGVIFLFLVGVVGFYVWINRHFLMQWLDQLGNRSQLAGPGQSASAMTGQTAIASRPFSSFRQPSKSEQDPRKVVVMTFAALDAWARDAGVGRGNEETPSEFLKRLKTQFPFLADPASTIVQSYNDIVYGKSRRLDGSSAAGVISDSDRLWIQLNQVDLSAGKSARQATE